MAPKIDGTNNLMKAHVGTLRQAIRDGHGNIDGLKEELLQKSRVPMKHVEDAAWKKCCCAIEAMKEHLQGEVSLLKQKADKLQASMVQQESSLCP